MKEKILSWLKIMRLQFYLMTFISYSLGAALLPNFDRRVFLLGFLVIFLVELATVLTNEYYDYPSDKINKNASPFNGGSRMLVEGKIERSKAKRAIFIVLGGVFLSGYLLTSVVADASIFSVVWLLGIGIFLGLGYTAPPIKFCYRGWGEFVVGITHSIYVILCGYVFQGGAWGNSHPWLISIPLFFAVLGAISLSGLPDYNADRAVSKNTIAVIFGPQRAAMISMGFVALAAASAAALGVFKIILTYRVMFIIIPHAVILLVAIAKFITSGDYDRKINGIMQLALSYIIWFGIFPLGYLLYGQH